MTDVAERVRVVRDAIDAACARCGRDAREVGLLPISKRHSTAAIRAVQELGLSAFGENRVQELVEKAAELVDADVSWHFVGSVQTNKVNQLLRVESLALLHSLDRVKLADVLQTALASAGRSLDVLLQIDATGDENKHGATPDEAPALLRHLAADCPNLHPVGVMAMGPLDADPAPVFHRVATLHEDLRQATGLPLPIRSMGMTADLDAAIAQGSTLVRVGTGIFGQRP